QDAPLDVGRDEGVGRRQARTDGRTRKYARAWRRHAEPGAAATARAEAAGWCARHAGSAGRTRASTNHAGPTAQLAGRVEWAAASGAWRQAGGTRRIPRVWKEEVKRLRN